MFLEEKREGEQRLQPSAKNLAYVLRHEELWPKDFVWDYNRCTNCAMGLAHRLWPEVELCSGEIAQAIGIDRSTASKIFCYGNPNLFGVARRSPKQIAKALEKL